VLPSIDPPSYVPLNPAKFSPLSNTSMKLIKESSSSYLFICGLFNNAVCSCNYKALNDRKIYPVRKKGIKLSLEILFIL
jgi:hypothetical protein